MKRLTAQTMNLSKSQRIAAAIFALGAGLTFTFSNCAKVSFVVDAESIIGKLNAGGGIMIDNDAEFTKSTQVQLTLVNGSAEQMYITVDPTCKSGGNWEKYVPQKAYQLSQKNQMAKVYVKYREQVDSDLESDCFHDEIVHDDIAPALSLVKGMNAFTAASSARFEFLASDAGSGLESVECFQNGSKKTCGPNAFDISGLTEGMHAIKLTAADKAGNESAPLSASFGVDRTPPTVSLVSTPASLTSGALSSFSFTGADALSGLAGFECRFDSDASMSSCSSPLVRNLSSGSHTFYVKAIDKVGNRSQEVKYAWVIDQTAPSLQFTKTPLPKTNLANSTFAFDGVDDGQPITNFKCSVDGGAYASCTSPRTLTVAEGTHQFSVIGVDTAGNNSQPISYSWIVDLTKPIVTITAKPEAVTKDSDANFAFSASDALTGVASTE